MTRRLTIVFAITLVLALAVAGCGGAKKKATPTPAGLSPETLAQGKQLYEQSCSACHGPVAKGLPNLGKDLTTSEFAKGLSDDQLLDFVKKGRPVGDSANTTGVDMPPKGGNPALTDDQLKAIIAYVRTLEKK